MKRIFANVKLGENVRLGDFVIVGLPPEGKEDGELETVIGSNAIIRSHTVIYAGNRIGDNLRTGHSVLIREGCEIGHDVSIGSHSIVEDQVKIGNRVRIHSNVFIPQHCLLEEESWIGPGVAFTNVLHPLCPQAKRCWRGATVKKGAKLGANCTLLPDIVIGEGALVGAGSVITKDVPAGKVVAGNPARILRDINQLTCPYGIVEKPYQGL